METEKPKENIIAERTGERTGRIISDWIGSLSPDLNPEDFESLLIETLNVPETITSLTVEELEKEVRRLKPLPLELANNVIRSIYIDYAAPEEILEGSIYNRWIGLALTLYFGVIATQAGLIGPDRPWRKLKQGPIANELLKTITKDKSGVGKNTIVDIVGGSAQTRGDNLAITITAYENVGGLTISTHRLFDYMIQAWTETGHEQGGFDINFQLREYWEEFGLSPSGSARQQVSKDLTILASPIHYRWINDKGKTDQLDFNIFEFTSIKNGRVLAKMTETAKSLYKNYSVMPFHPDTWKFDLRRNQHSPYLFRRIQQHKHMNRNKDNENKIRVKTLLEAAPLMPTYEEVSAGGRQFTQRIIEPFERDLNALETAGLTWEYMDPGQKGSITPSSGEDGSLLSFQEWENLVINFEWDDYPYSRKEEEETKELEAGPGEEKPTKREKKEGTPKSK